MVDLILTRRKYTGKQTIGTIDIYKDNIFQYTLMSLEKPWRNNEINESCIPKGFYTIEHYNSEKHPSTFVVQDTSPRSYILIHKGNYYSHSAGCILVGLTLSYLNEDDYLDTKYSTEAMQKLNEICLNEKYISLTIK